MIDKFISSGIRCAISLVFLVGIASQAALGSDAKTDFADGCSKIGSGIKKGFLSVVKTIELEQEE